MYIFLVWVEYDASATAAGGCRKCSLCKYAAEQLRSRTSIRCSDGGLSTNTTSWSVHDQRCVSWFLLKHHFTFMRFIHNTFFSMFLLISLSVPNFSSFMGFAILHKPLLRQYASFLLNVSIAFTSNTSRFIPSGVVFPRLCSHFQILLSLSVRRRSLGCDKLRKSLSWTAYKWSVCTTRVD